MSAIQLPTVNHIPEITGITLTIVILLIYTVYALIAHQRHVNQLRDNGDIVPLTDIPLDALITFSIAMILGIGLGSYLYITITSQVS